MKDNKRLRIEIYPDMESNDVIVKFSIPKEYSEREFKSLMDAATEAARVMEKKIRYKHVFRRYGNK